MDVRDESMSDREAFEEFVATRTPALTRTAYLLTGDPHLAEDLVQSALLKTAEHWARIHSSPEAYARRTMYRLQISSWRRRSRVREQTLESFDAALTVGDADVRLSVRDALALLTARQRVVLVLRFFEDLTEQQVADHLGISRGSVKSTTRQAFERLRRVAPHLADLVEDPA